MNGFLIVAAGGAIGAALRHGVGQVTFRYLPQGWPYGTFTVNILGSLAMGFLIGWLALKAEGISQTARLFIATGVLGGFTTFSAFSLEVAEFIRTDNIGKAFAYAGLSLTLGVTALFFGLWIARRMFT